MLRTLVFSGTVSDLFTTPRAASTTPPASPTNTHTNITTTTTTSTTAQEGYVESVVSFLYEASMTCDIFTHCRLSALNTRVSRVEKVVVLEYFTPLTSNTTSPSLFSSAQQVEECPSGSVVVGVEYIVERGTGE